MGTRLVIADPLKVIGPIDPSLWVPDGEASIAWAGRDHSFLRDSVQYVCAEVPRQPSLLQPCRTTGSFAATPLSTPGVPSVSVACLAVDVDLRLLRDTQAYLGSLATAVVPSRRCRRAWEEFFHLHDPMIRRVVRASRLSRADSEDCVQEVWMAIVTRLPRFDYDPRRGRFCCWLFTLIRNRVIDFVRSLERVPTVTIDGLQGTLCSRELDPADAYEWNRKRRIVQEVLAVLEERTSPTNYRMLQLRWIEGRSAMQVALVLGLTFGQVYKRHHRLKQKLRRLLEASGAVQAAVTSG